MTNVLLFNFLYIVIINTPKNNSSDKVIIMPIIQIFLYKMKSEQIEKIMNWNHIN